MSRARTGRARRQTSVTSVAERRLAAVAAMSPGDETSAVRYARRLSDAGGDADGEIDRPRLLLGAGATAAATLGGGEVLIALFHDPAGTGATAATIDEAFLFVCGSALGLAIGTAFTSAFVRRGSRWIAGFCGGLLAYGLVLAPLFVAYEVVRSDLGIGESIVLATVLALPAAAIANVGAAAGASIARRWTSRGRHP